METKLELGTIVYSLDGKEVGKVKEIRGDIFKVDARMQPDYWLRCNAVHGDQPGVAHVGFAAASLKDHLAPPPRD
jgi:hypothetical protein